MRRHQIVVSSVGTENMQGFILRWEPDCLRESGTMQRIPNGSRNCFVICFFILPCSLMPRPSWMPCTASCTHVTYVYIGNDCTWRQEQFRSNPRKISAGAFLICVSRNGYIIYIYIYMCVCVCLCRVYPLYTKHCRVNPRRGRASLVRQFLTGKNTSQRL